MPRLRDVNEDYILDHPARFGCWVVGIVIALTVLIGSIGWVGGWFSEAARVTGVQNTKEQAYQLRDGYQSLIATAGNYCEAKGAKSSENDPQLVGGDPSFQYAATYRSIKAEYDRRMSNAFEAGWVSKYPMLNDLPKRAPGLSEMTAEVC